MTEEERGCANAAAAILAWGPLFLLRAWSLLSLWTWFAVPLGGPALTIPGVAGLLCIRMVAFPGKHKPGEKISAYDFISTSLIVSLIPLGVGAFARWVSA